MALAFPQPSREVAHPFRRGAQLAALSGGLAGLAILVIGWLEAAGPGTAAGATSLVLLGVALWQTALPVALIAPSRSASRMSALTGALVAGIAPLAAWLAMREGSPLPPVITISLSLLGGAVLLVEVDLGQRIRPAELLALAALVLSLAFLLGEAWAPSAELQLPEMSLGCALLALAVLASRPDRGIMATIAGDGAGGLVARALLSGTLLAALVAGLVYSAARRLALTPEVSLGAAVAETLAGAVAFAWVLGRRVDRLDSSRMDREMTVRRLSQELSLKTRAEEQLRVNEARLLAAQELAQVGSWSWDPENGTVAWSGELSRIFGREPKEDRGSLDTFLEPVHPDDRARLRRLLENSRKDGKRFHCEYRVERAEGRVSTVLSRARPIFAPSGAVARLEGIAQDVTEHREEEEVFRYRDVLEQKFSAALEGLWLAYQPIVEWSARKVFAYEALVRSTDPVLRNPGVLLRAAEKLGRIRDIGEQVRTQAAYIVASAEKKPQVFVNLHVHDLLDETLYRADSPLAAVAPSIVLEITERGGLEELKDVRSRVAGLRQLGYRLAIDDLGAGYSGLITFAQLEPDFVKLDMSLVRDVHRDSTKRRLAEGVAALCRRMGIRLVAEGIETSEERDAMVEIGCDLLQGYLFAMPGKAFPAVTWQ